MKLSEASRVITTCALCFKANQASARQENAFGKSQQLRAFDPFGGTGAFALSMQEEGILKLTHAIEISPSAVKTLRYL